MSDIENQVSAVLEEIPAADFTAESYAALKEELTKLAGQAVANAQAGARAQFKHKENALQNMNRATPDSLAKLRQELKDELARLETLVDEDDVRRLLPAALEEVQADNKAGQRLPLLAADFKREYLAAFGDEQRRRIKNRYERQGLNTGAVDLGV